MTKVLFLCVHNSARSQMAEAWLNALCATGCACLVVLGRRMRHWVWAEWPMVGGNWTPPPWWRCWTK